MQRKIGFMFAVMLCLTAVAQATPVITLSTYVLLPETAGQTIDIFVSGGDPVQGVNLNAIIGDGSPGAPKFTSADLISAGHTFASNHNPPFTFIDSGGRQLAVTFSTASGTVPATGNLATLVIDTHGAAPGLYALDLAGDNVNNALGADTDFAGVPANITNGFIQVVPEPGSIVLGLFAVAGLGAVAIRKRRARRA